MGGYCTSRRAHSILLFVSIYPEFAEIFQDDLHVSSIQSEQTRIILNLRVDPELFGTIPGNSGQNHSHMVRLLFSESGTFQ